MFETLETRQHLDAVQVGGIVNVNGTKANDTINVIEDSSNANQLHVEITSNGVMTTYDFNGVTAINVSGQGGSDQIFYTGHSVGANIHGDNKNPKLAGAPGGTGGT